VFRPPPLARILAVFVGSGFQLFVMTILTLCFATLGFLSPANRGALLSSVLVFFVLMGLPAGYMSARFSKLLKEENQVCVMQIPATEHTHANTHIHTGVCVRVCV